MKRILSLASAALLLLSIFAGAGAAQDTPKKRREVVVKLQNDVNKAMANANLTDDQKKTLEASRETLRKAAMKRRGGEKADKRQMRNALQDLRSIFQSEAFKPEDRQAVQDDLKQLLEQGQARRRRAA